MQYYGQNEQDRILNEKYFDNKKSGVFVDIGAHDGISGSNTYFFERELRWSGICLEPIPEVFEKLVKNRNCICSDIAAWTEKTTKKFRKITGHSEMLSGFVDTYHPSHLARISDEFVRHSQDVEDIEVECEDINVILDKWRIFDIDIFSIDTEGSEYQIIKHLDFGKFKVKVFVIENNYGDTSIEEFLKTKGYKKDITVGVDEFYIKN